MSGLNRTTGRAISGQAHIAQSIAEIIFTPVGSRVERRDFGSLLPELIDQPDNAATRIRMYSAVAGALIRWEPRVRVSRVRIQSGAQAGQTTLSLDGLFQTASGQAQALSLRLPLQQRAAL